MHEYKAIHEASENSIANWPSHCLTADDLETACEMAFELTSPVGARVLKVLVDGLVCRRIELDCK